MASDGRGVLVTGSTGFLGQYILRDLAADWKVKDKERRERRGSNWSDAASLPTSPPPT